MNELIRIEFNLISKTKLYFGSNEQGMLMKDSDDKPFIMGSSIGGCIKSYLKSIKNSNINIDYYFGGESNEKVFNESKLTIYDAEILNKKDSDTLIGIKEGTRINAVRGVAEDSNKYTTEYLLKDTNIVVAMEIELLGDQSRRDEFYNLMEIIRIGFEKKLLRLGGQINSGFGKMKIDNITVKTVNLANENELIDYLLYKKYKEDKITSFAFSNNQYNNFVKHKLIFKLEGSFPYGVYQHFDCKDKKSITGIQKEDDIYYIPSSSIKGLMRNELEKLLNNSLINENLKSKCVSTIFGSTDTKGAGVFQDILIENEKIIKDNDKVEDNFTTYNKIDRLTGGSFNSALMKQRDIRGNAIISFELDRERTLEYIYPLLIILRDIAWGIIPIGGRTSIGLGEFYGTSIKLEDTKGEYNLNITVNKKKDVQKNEVVFKDNSKNNIERLKEKFNNL